MDVLTWRRPDGLALAAAALAAGTAMTYVWLIDAQGDEPRSWFLSLLLAGAVLAGFGAVLKAPWKRIALVLSAAVLLPAGALALASIGLPIVVAGALAVLASLRTTEATGA